MRALYTAIQTRWNNSVLSAIFPNLFEEKIPDYESTGSFTPIAVVTILNFEPDEDCFSNPVTYVATVEFDLLLKKQDVDITFDAIEKMQQVWDYCEFTDDFTGAGANEVKPKGYNKFSADNHVDHVLFRYEIRVQRDMNRWTR